MNFYTFYIVEHVLHILIPLLKCAFRYLFSTIGDFYFLLIFEEKENDNTTWKYIKTFVTINVSDK